LVIDRTCIVGRPVAASTTVIGWSACPASIRARHSARVGSRLVRVMPSAEILPGLLRVGFLCSKVRKATWAGPAVPG
jgi:hypothetical protein